MPTIKRADGIQFAIHTYRELLAFKRAAVLRNEVRVLAQNHGKYVRLLKTPQKNIEAIFSREPGFLLGETVWHYFGRPSDLVYCEALPEGQSAIVVVIKAGTVYLDTKIPFNSIIDEFASLITGNNQYNIYIYGDVPISNEPAPNKFNFDAAFVKSFTRLEDPVFPQLPAEDALQLQPLEMALRTFNTWQKPSKKTVSILLGVLLALLFWWYIQSSEKPVQVTMPTAATPVNPYADFENALSTPSPRLQLNETANIIDTLYTLPGWTATSISFSGRSYQVALNSVGGTYELLQQWTLSHHFQLTLDTAGASLTIPASFPNRNQPKTAQPLQPILITLMDRMNMLLAGTGNVTLGNITTVGAAKSAEITIGFSQISPDLLTLIGDQIAGLPIRLNGITFTMANGLLSGTINLNVLGR